MKCKFWKKCKWYDKEDVTCNKTGGGYYDDGEGLRPAGCYREMESKLNSSKIVKLHFKKNG